MTRTIAFFIIVFIQTLLMSDYHYLLMGSPGSGKGTFSQFMQKECPGQFVHICVGDLLRDEIDQETSIGKEIKERVTSGQLVPAEITFSLIRKQIIDCLQNKTFLLLDGLVQNQENIDFFDELLKELQLEESFRYVSFTIPKELARKRILSRLICNTCRNVALPGQQIEPNSYCPLCGGRFIIRLDDTNATIERRLNRFFDKVEPLIKQYKYRDRFFEFDSTKKLDYSFEEYRNALFAKT